MKVVDDDGIEAVQTPKAVKTEFDPVAEGYHLIEGLPSNCKLYPEGTQIYGRPLKVLECKQLANINETNADNIINSILKRTVKGMDVDQILVADKLFILLWLRGTTFPDPSYGIGFKCSVCEKEANYTFSLDKIETRQIDTSFTIDKLTFKMPKGDEIEFKFPTIAEEKIADNFKNTCTYIKDIDSDLVNQSVLIKRINGEEKIMLEKYNYLSSLSPSDYVYFLSYIEKWTFGIKWVINVVCNHCGGTTPMGATFLGDSTFWLPRVDIP